MATPLTPAAPAPAAVASFPSNRSYESGPGLSGGRVVSERTVGYAIKVLADLKIGEREFSGEIDMHAVVCLRRKYEEMGGGTVTLRPDWKPGLQRLTPVTQEQLGRVIETMHETYVVPRANGGVLDIFSLFYGAEPSQQLKRIHEVMRLQMDAWAKLTERAIARVPEASRPRDRNVLLTMAFELIAPRELEDIARIADPSSNEEGLSVELPAALMPATAAITAQAGAAASQMSLDDLQRQAAHDADASGADAEQLALVGRLEKAGVSPQHALAVASTVELMDGDISDEAIAAAIESTAKGKIDAVRRALKG